MPSTKTILLQIILLAMVVVPYFGIANNSLNSDSLFRQLKLLPENEERINIYLALAKEYEPDDLDAAFVWINKAEKLSSKMEHTQGLYEVARCRVLFNYNHGLLDSALHYSSLSFEENLVLTPSDSADIYNLIGVSYEAKGKIDSALFYLNHSLEIYRQQKLDKGIIKVLANMGNSFYEAGLNEQALEYSKEAYKMAIETKDLTNIPILTSNYAVLLLIVENDTSKVNTLLSEVLKNPVLRENPDMLSAIYQNLALFYLSIDNLEDSNAKFNLALKAVESSSYTIDPGIYTGLGIILSRQKKYKQAAAQFYLALKVASKQSVIRNIYSNLAETYTASEQIDSSSFYWKKYVEALRKSEDERLQKLMLKSKNNMDVILKENEITLLKKERKVNEVSQKLRMYTILGLILIVVLIAVIAVLLLKQKRKELDLQKAELKLKNQNLVSLSLQINQKNQILKDFERKLVDDKASDDLVYQDLKKTLSQSLRIDKDWEKFELYFNDLHKGFYSKLKAHYPELTNSELRVCSLVRLRFTLKETSEALSLSIDAIKSARYRIRKKINLATSENLSDHLNKF